jgi:hypothetical protein
MLTMWAPSGTTNGSANRGRDAQRFTTRLVV